jgi:hypothetical protein
MNLRTFILTLASIRPIQGTFAELRGFFATKFTDYSLSHQHNADKFMDVQDARDSGSRNQLIC